VSTAFSNPFLMLQATDYYTPDSQLREENRILKEIIAAQDTQALTLKTEIADLHRLLGLRAEAADLEQRIEERQG
jgi:hypothetical protein